ncbi:hypothetical protein NMG60_11018124 [Bertholletia excelsa]
MVKMTIVGRATDGLPLAKGPRYVNEEDENFSHYMQQAEFVLQEISRSGSIAPSKMTIRIDSNYFNFMVENGVCFITLCDSSYPRKLAFHYLEDLQKEFEKFDPILISKITKPYSFVRFDRIIGNTRRQYTDTRTQSNLSKLNANRRQELEIITQDMCTIVERRRKLEMLEKGLATPRVVSKTWSAPFLEQEIALKWTPITLVFTVAAVLLWTSLILTDNLVAVTF